ncbi:transcription initiation factor IID, 31kD subunit-domain-containing protein [Schizothecium vesticola]|uniref:Transcription initiation factor IID, 31kD subunit-domain-containing protein n=1 Tax=Schizothecium vesticola TaxID=314040 RepID=A0AA40KC87_9PEZI|nr:transcription initiation factor IID, 31kD subunit-domain-containing protein [Schizothecium vesticola]
MSAPGAPAQTNGVPSQTSTSPTMTQPAAPPTASPSQPQPPATTTQQPPPQPSAQQPHNALPSTTAPRPRDARTIELLLTAQGVTAYEQRVPLLLLDFAYRHTSAVLTDALHLAADPYTSHAGARPSAASGAAPVNVGDAHIGAGAIQLAIASRLAYQFRGAGGGISKDWMLEQARERNKVALPRVAPSEWGARLPGERFVLNGSGWGLRDVWAGQPGEEEEDSEEDFGGMGGEAMEGVETEDITGDGVEGGTMGDVFGDEGLDEEMEEV